MTASPGRYAQYADPNPRPAPSRQAAERALRLYESARRGWLTANPPPEGREAETFAERMRAAHEAGLVAVRDDGVWAMAAWAQTGGRR